MSQGLRINEVRVVFQEGSDNFRELVELSGGAQAHSFQGHSFGAGFKEEVEAHFAQEGEVGRVLAAAAALEVFAEDDVEPPVQVVLHLSVLPHAAGDDPGPGLEAGDEKPPPFGGFAGNEVEGFAPAQGGAGETASLAPAGGIRAAPGIDVAGEAVLAVGGIPADDGVFELKVAQGGVRIGGLRRWLRGGGAGPDRGLLLCSKG